MLSSPPILCLETSSDSCSAFVAGCEDSFVFEQGMRHSSLLPSIVYRSIDKAGLGKDQIAALAISEGPGSFTGLRAGYAYAKAWCYAQGMPLIPIHTHDIIAQSVEEKTGKQIIVLIWARNGNCYYKHYVDGMAVGPPLFDTCEQALTADPVSDLVLIDQRDVADEVDLSSYNYLCQKADARLMGPLAVKYWGSGKWVDLAYSEPLYLRGANITRSKNKAGIGGIKGEDTDENR